MITEPELSKLVDILSSTTIHYKSMMLAIAKINPQIVIEAYERYGICDTLPELDVYMEEGKIPAIKYVRYELKLGLREAKDYVEDYAVMKGHKW